MDFMAPSEKSGMQSGQYAGTAVLDALSQAPKFNAWMADTVLPYLGSRVLEVGAGTGNMTHHLSANRERYVATDIDDGHLDRLRACFRDDSLVAVEKLDAADPDAFKPFRNGFDSALLLNVLEHVEDDAAALRHIKTTLVSGGRIIVLVPNDPSAYGTVDEALGHCRRYTPAGLSDKLAAAGFLVEKLILFNRVSYPGWRFTGKVLKARTLSPLMMKWFDCFVWLWRRLDAYLPWKATSIVAIGSKR